MFRLYKVKNLKNGIVKTFSSENVAPPVTDQGHLPDPTKVLVTRYQADIPESRTEEYLCQCDINGNICSVLTDVIYMRWGQWHREDGPALETYNAHVPNGLNDYHWYLYGNHVDSWDEYQMWTQCQDSKIVALKLKHGEPFNRIYK